MSDCKKYKRQFDKALYGELNKNELIEFNKHLGTCDECANEYEELQNTLNMVKQRTREEVDPQFMNNFWNKLEPKLEKQSSSFNIWLQQLKEKMAIEHKWGYQLAGGLTILILGILLGKYFISGPITDHQIPIGDDDSNMNVIEAKANNYIERSKVLLMGLMNFDPGTDDAEAVNLNHQKNISSDLITQAAELRKELEKPSQKQLKDLIGDIEVILMQIANLETDYDLSGIELIQSGVDRKGIFLKINIREMQESKSNSDTPKEKKKEIKKNNI